MDPDNKPGFDGRADIVRFQPRRGARWELSDLRLAEDVFTTIGEADGNAGRARSPRRSSPVPAWSGRCRCGPDSSVTSDHR